MSKEDKKAAWKRRMMDGEKRKETIHDTKRT